MGAADGTPRGVSMLLGDVQGWGGMWVGLGMGGAWWPALVMQRSLPFLHRVPKMPSASPVWSLSQTSFPAPTPRFFRTHSVDSPPVPKSEPPPPAHCTHARTHTHTHAHACPWHVSTRVHRCVQTLRDGAAAERLGGKAGQQGLFWKLLSM